MAGCSYSGGFPLPSVIAPLKRVGQAQSSFWDKRLESHAVPRYLANKCSLASRIDCFGDVATSVYGSKMKDQVKHGACS